MSTMQFQDIIGLRPAQWKAVEKKAKSAGTSAKEYVRRVIERDLLAGQTFVEMMKPVREDVRKSGLTEDQLDEIVREARIATAQPRKTRKARR